jgi:hypothetical protein
MAVVLLWAFPVVLGRSFERFSAVLPIFVPMAFLEVGFTLGMPKHHFYHGFCYNGNGYFSICIL